ncbi:MAG: hypothetical protein ACTSRE_02275 [Promethearchaeota archaeon]
MAIFLVITLGFISLGCALGIDIEWEDDTIKNLGVAAFALFAISLVYVFFSQIMRFTMKLNKEKERNVKFKENYLKFFKVIRKPLLIVHYLASTTAIILLAIHGISMLPENNEQAVLGIITGSFLAFYIITGIIMKFILPKLKKAKNIRKYMYFIHRSLIVILIVLAIHIAHVAS